MSKWKWVTEIQISLSVSNYINNLGLKKRKAKSNQTTKRWQFTPNSQQNSATENNVKILYKPKTYHNRMSLSLCYVALFSIALFCLEFGVRCQKVIWDQILHHSFHANANISLMIRMSSCFWWFWSCIFLHFFIKRFLHFQISWRMTGWWRNDFSVKADILENHYLFPTTVSFSHVQCWTLICKVTNKCICQVNIVEQKV